MDSVQVNINRGGGCYGYTIVIRHFKGIICRRNCNSIYGYRSSRVCTENREVHGIYCCNICSPHGIAPRVVVKSGSLPYTIITGICCRIICFLIILSMDRVRIKLYDDIIKATSTVAFMIYASSEAEARLPFELNAAI